MTNEKILNSIAIGAILKYYREQKELSQADIASQLGYRNVNFISMIESGKSNIPIARTIDIANAYQLDSEMTMIVVMKLHPDFWKVAKHLIMFNPQLRKMKFEEVEELINKRFSEIAKVLDVPVS